MTAEMEDQKMEVTGNKLYELLQIWTTKRDALIVEFTDCLMSFDEEKKRDPFKINEELLAAEFNIVEIEIAQREFNQKAKTSEGLGIETAIKQLGILKRAVGRWKPAAQNTSIGGYVREKDSVYAKPTITPPAAQELVEEFTRRLLSLKAQIADANSTRVEVTLAQDITSV
jgi:hypothetical protein